MTRFLNTRLGPAAGALGSALLFIGLMITNGATEAMSIADGPATVAHDYAAHRDEIRLGVALALAGVFLAVWFLGYLCRRVEAAADEGGWLGSVVLAGGAIGLAAVLVYLGVLIAATNEAIVAAPETARTFLFLSWEYGGVLSPAYGSFVGATSIALIRGSRVPMPARTIGWLGVPLALALALSGFLGGFFVVLALLWQLALALVFLLVPGAVRPLHATTPGARFRNAGVGSSQAPGGALG
jgi:hypothetical protein